MSMNLVCDDLIILCTCAFVLGVAAVHAVRSLETL